MGNTNSVYKDANTIKADNIYDVITTIATDYILTMDFQSMQSLSNKTYCDQLVVLTSEIINKYFNEVDISYMSNQLNGTGAPNGTLTNKSTIFFNRDQLDKYTARAAAQEGQHQTKRAQCIGIAKFYVQIAHLFAAIVMTVNPVYVYTDPTTGQRVQKTLYEKASIPRGVKKDVYKLNICNDRIKALRRVKKDIGMTPNSDKSNNSMENVDTEDMVYMHPKICDINVLADGAIKHLTDEPGISELEQLYYDVYNYQTGKFDTMSPTAKVQYDNDVMLFYNVFTGNTGALPDNIKRFSDIRLTDYNKQANCRGGPAEAPFKKGVKINNTDPLYIKYANHINTMITDAVNTQEELLGVLRNLFGYVVDPYTEQKTIKINPALNRTTMQQLVNDTTLIISRLYLDCEHDYVEGIKIYESIIEKQILTTTKRQIANLEESTKQMVRSPGAAAVTAYGEKSPVDLSVKPITLKTEYSPGNAFATANDILDESLMNSLKQVSPPPPRLDENGSYKQSPLQSASMMNIGENGSLKQTSPPRPFDMPMTNMGENVSYKQAPQQFNMGENGSYKQPLPSPPVQSNIPIINNQTLSSVPQQQQQQQQQQTKFNMPVTHIDELNGNQPLRLPAVSYNNTTKPIQFKPIAPTTTNSAMTYNAIKKPANVIPQKNVLDMNFNTQTAAVQSQPQVKPTDLQSRPPSQQQQQVKSTDLQSRPPSQQQQPQQQGKPTELQNKQPQQGKPTELQSKPQATYSIFGQQTKEPVVTEYKAPPKVAEDAIKLQNNTNIFEGDPLKLNLFNAAERDEVKNEKILNQFVYNTQPKQTQSRVTFGNAPTKQTQSRATFNNAKSNASRVTFNDISPQNPVVNNQDNYRKNVPIPNELSPIANDDMVSPPATKKVNTIFNVNNSLPTPAMNASPPHVLVNTIKPSALINKIETRN